MKRRQKTKKGQKPGPLGTMTMVLKRRDWLLAKIFLGAFGVFVLALGWSLWPYWQLSREFATLPTEQPSRLYGRAFRLHPGQGLAREALVEELEALDYAPADARGLLPGRYRAEEARVRIARRRFRAPVADAGGGLLEIEFRGARVGRVLIGERPVAEAWLEPPLLATFYGPELMERRPVALEEVPVEVVRAVLAAEDSNFFEHPGLSATGIARALWTNLRGGEVRQGGSTITQQLAKNLYLSHERTMGRKLREAMLAFFLEWRYEKEGILEAYLNHIYWGRSGSANVIGVGAASYAYFGRPVSELGLAEGALLAAMIKAPADYLPTKHPEAARGRRDFVLDRLAKLGWVEPEAAEAAKSAPLPDKDYALSRRSAPYYADAVRAELERRWGIRELSGRGLSVYGTLDVADQRAAEMALREGLDELAESNARVRAKRDQFQGALVSIEPATGAVRAWVGGREYRDSQFDRVSQARRQAGSAFKPIVYATAFETGVATPATLLEDEPLEVRSGGRLWTPSNDDGEFHGWVTARTALEQSYNVPTARLAMQLGLPRVVAMARACGITTPLKPVPAMALGAFEVSPVELLTAYATIANRGLRPPVHLVTAVLDPRGEPLAGEGLPAPERALSAESAYLVTTLLQGVLDYGTGRRARSLGLRDAVAGKTGTSNERRDNWFAGFSPERATIVWVGFDDDSPTPFSGSRAALPIWTAFELAVRPPDGFAKISPPNGIRVVLIDPATGELATDRCPEVLAEAFPDGRVPTAVCREHGGWFAQPIDPGVRAEREEEEGGLRNWLKRIFGRERDERGSADAPPQGPPP